MMLNGMHKLKRWRIASLHNLVRYLSIGWGQKAVRILASFPQKKPMTDFELGKSLWTSKSASERQKNSLFWKGEILDLNTFGAKLGFWFQPQTPWNVREILVKYCKPLCGRSRHPYAPILSRVNPIKIFLHNCWIASTRSPTKSAE